MGNTSPRKKTEMPLQISSNLQPKSPQSGLSPKIGNHGIQARLNQFIGISNNQPYLTSNQVIGWYSFFTITGIGLLILSYVFLSWLTPWDFNGTSDKFWGVTLYIFIFPLGFMFTLSGLSGIIIMKELSPRFRTIITALFAIISLFTSIFFLFPSIYDGIAYFYLSIHHKNQLYKSLESLEMFLLYFGIFLILCMICIRLILYDILIGQTSHYQLIHSSTTKPLYYKYFFNKIIILSFLFILLPLCFVSTTLLPNIWTHFDISTIIEWSQNPAPLANKQWTVDIKVGKYYLHCYFDTIIFYSSLLLTASISFILRQCCKNQSILKYLRKIIIYIDTKQIKSCSSWLPRTFYLTTSNLIVLIIWIITFGVIFYYWAFIHHYGPGNHLYNPLNIAGPTDNDHNNYPIILDRIARAFGILSTICCGLLLIPITRSNVNRILEYCFGIEFQEGIIYHKFLGALFLIFSFAHFSIFLILFIFYSKRDDNAYIPFFNIPWNYHQANFTINIMYLVLLLIIIPIFYIISCINSIRRYWFELFYYLHIYGAQVLILSILFHSSNSWYYLLPGLILQFIERLYRLYNCTQIAKLVNLEQVSTVITRLELAIPHKYSFASGKWSSMNDNKYCIMGQYIFINIPNLSIFEWHPFSISNPLNHPSTVFYIKNMYRGWTQKLNKLSSKSYYISALNICIEGPYGITLDYWNYNTIILIAGGVGITPMHNLFFTLYGEIKTNPSKYTRNNNNNGNNNVNNIPNIELWWINRRADAFSYYIDSFRQFQSNPVKYMKIKLYATRENSRNSVVSDCVVRSSHFQQSRQSGYSITWDARRPYLPTALSFMKSFKEKGLIFVCGPTDMVTDCLKAAYQNGNHFKREYFLW